MPQEEKNPGYPGTSGVYRVRKEFLQAARADAEAAPEPELVENGAFVKSKMLIKWYVFGGEEVEWRQYPAALVVCVSLVNELTGDGRVFYAFFAGVIVSPFVADCRFSERTPCFCYSVYSAVWLQQLL